MSWFQALSDGNGRKLLRLAPCPTAIALQAVVVVPVPEFDPPDPEPLLEPALAPVLEFDVEEVLELDVPAEAPPAHEIRVLEIEASKRTANACFALAVKAASTAIVHRQSGLRTAHKDSRGGYSAMSERVARCPNQRP